MHRRPTPRPTPLAALLALVAGCTTVSGVNLQPGTVAVERPLAGTVRVEATGSPRRAGIGSRAIGSEALAAAVRETLLGSGLCAGVVEQGPADHVLRVEVLEVERSDLKLDMEAAVTARWTLLDGAGAVALREGTVATHGKSTSLEAGMVEDRAQLALEDATRKNIMEGLRQLCRTPAGP